VLRIGPPWPSEEETVIYSVLLVAATLYFVGSSGRLTSRPEGGGRHSAVLVGFVFCAAAYLLLKVFFCYNAADWRHQVAGGFVLRPQIKDLLDADPNLTVQKALDGYSNDATRIWESWSVFVVRAGLLLSWLGCFLCITVVAARALLERQLWSLDDRVYSLVPEVDTGIRTELQSIMRTLRVAESAHAAIVMMSGLALRLFRLIYGVAGKPWPSDNLFDVVVLAGKGDRERNLKGYGILPDGLDSPLHTLRIFSNKVDHASETFQMGVEEAELVMNAFLALLRWFYCESGLVPKLPSIYLHPGMTTGAATVSAQIANRHPQATK
jgi:hypothetical protein